MSIGIGMIVAQSLSFPFSRPFQWRYVLLVGLGVAVVLFFFSGVVARICSGLLHEQDERSRLLEEREEVKDEVSVRGLGRADTIVKRGCE